MLPELNKDVIYSNRRDNYVYMSIRSVMKYSLWRNAYIGLFRYSDLVKSRSRADCKPRFDWLLTRLCAFLSMCHCGIVQDRFASGF